VNHPKFGLREARLNFTSSLQQASHAVSETTAVATTVDELLAPLAEELRPISADAA
jgi:hypothetical protein